MPEEFSHLQAQDMSKLGFMQDLIRGIKKIISADASKQVVRETVISGASNAATVPLLERVFLFLEDGKWQDANIYCEKVLDIDPKNAEAYLGKLMAELQVKNRKLLADCDMPFDDRDNFSKVIRFGDEKLESEMRGYIAHIKERNENARLIGIYKDAMSIMSSAGSEGEYITAAKKLESIPEFKDSKELAVECRKRAKECCNDSIYAKAKSMMDRNTISDCSSAISEFEKISGWRDADEQICACKKRIEEIKAKQEADRLEAERRAEERRIEEEKAKKSSKKPLTSACLPFAPF